MVRNSYCKTLYITHLFSFILTSDVKLSLIRNASNLAYRAVYYLNKPKIRLWHLKSDVDPALKPFCFSLRLVSSFTALSLCLWVGALCLAHVARTCSTHHDYRPSWVMSFVGSSGVKFDPWFAIAGQYKCPLWQKENNVLKNSEICNV